MMTRKTIQTFALLAGVAALPALAACNGDDTGSTDTATATMTATATTTATTTGTTTDSTTDSTSETTTDSTSTTDDPTTSTTTSTTSETGTTGEDPFVFDDTPPDQLTQIDRMGMPAINTAVITSKDDYNAATPADDANGDFVDEITTNVTGLHAALDDDLVGLNLTPCAAPACVSQAAPLVVPDTLKLDLTGDAGFPNGRLPADPVMDVTLAVVLLDLNVHDAGTLAGVPVNPPANDKAFLTDFPYLAEPH
jgi:hypothetical protein